MSTRLLLLRLSAAWLALLFYLRAVDQSYYPSGGEEEEPPAAALDEGSDEGSDVNSEAPLVAPAAASKAAVEDASSDPPAAPVLLQTLPEMKREAYQLARHNTEGGPLLVAIDGIVYDLSRFAAQHPGGDRADPVGGVGVVHRHRITRPDDDVGGADESF